MREPVSDKMAEGATSLRELRAQYVAAAQAQADERRSQSVNSPVLADPPPVIVKAPTKPVIDGSMLKTVERQRLAKARREEKEKEIAVKEYQLLEKEKKARLQYEKQVEERQKKLDEQRQKEQQKRVAVEEKRKQKQEEEKERYEAVLRRTLERSQRLEQRQKRWSWGGAMSTEMETSNGVPTSSLTPFLSLSDCPPPSSDSQTSTEDGSAIDKHSTSSGNLMKQAGPVMSKRLSSSSTALPSSPDKESHLCPRSASAGPVSSPINPANKPLRSRSSDRQKSMPGADAGVLTSGETTQNQVKEKRPSSPGSTSSRRRSPSPNIAKRPVSPSTTGTQRPPSPSTTGVGRSPSPTTVKRSSSPSTVKSSPKSRPPSPSTFRQHPPSPTSVRKPLQRLPTAVHRLPTAATGATLTKKKTEKEEKPKQKSEVTGAEKDSSVTSSKSKDSEQKPGTTSAEEAAKILAENRRLARELKEREELEKLQLAEAEKHKKEELQQKEAEENVRREEAACVQREERKLAEEEDQRKTEEERLFQELEEQDRLADIKLQREEAEAKAVEEAERQRLERERIMQQNQQERLERKKRIKEIMKRTRKEGQEQSKKDDMTLDAAAEESSEDEPRNEDADDMDSTNGIDELQDLAQDEVDLSDEAMGDTTGLNAVNQTNNITVHLNESVMGVSVVPKDNCVVSELLHVNDVGDGIVHQNGKSSTWIIDEFIELGVCSKTKLVVAACDAEGCNQSNPESHSIGCEENGGIASLTTPIMGATGL
ncbi:MAP7 domain-containing protein 2-like isoform X9 [Amblyraja radiata]|uniref:MAP7 domain-containing protein 2-like isoform X9 n=1 Tax=Amblyraja radiata TaxID=386614 RepID=UPI001402CA53|nr:MAP7 domain-containing protein 2-like isoform X9 [Amblyraja radiata]